MLAKVKQMISVVKAAKNPEAALMGMAESNPQLKQVMDVVKQSGNDPMKAFREMAEANGLDPDELLSMIS
jgi:L-serine deaminase